MSTAKAKVAMAKRTKMVITAVAVFIIVVAFVATYVLFFSYDNSTDNFTLSTQYSTWKSGSQLDKGMQIEVLVSVNYNSNDRITLTTSGSGAGWANFVQNVNNGQSFLSQITLSGGIADADMMIRIPNDAPSGSYEIVIIGTNSAGITSSTTYNFYVT